MLYIVMQETLYSPVSRFRCTLQVANSETAVSWSACDFRAGSP
jgi:hypothetical protein